MMFSKLLATISAALAVSYAAAGVVERQIIILGETTLHAWHAGVDLGVSVSLHIRLISTHASLSPSM